MNSKEGFLTKLGYHRKNWKLRWFTLFRNELKYFNNKEDKVCNIIIIIPRCILIVQDRACVLCLSV